MRKKYETKETLDDLYRIYEILQGSMEKAVKAHRKLSTTDFEDSDTHTVISEIVKASEYLTSIMSDIVKMENVLNGQIFIFKMKKLKNDLEEMKKKYE